MNFKEQLVVLDNRFVQHSKVDIKCCSPLELVGVKINDIQAKFISFMLASIKPTDTELKEIQIKYSDFCNLVNLSRGGKSDNLTKQSLTDIVCCSVLIETEDDYESFPWFQYFKLNKNTNMIKARLNICLTPYLTGLYSKRNYFMYEFGNIAHLKKSSSIVLYQWLHSHLNHKKINISINKLRNAILMLDENSYSKTKDLLKRVVNPAVEEINEKTDLIVEFETLTNKNDSNPNPKITSLSFTIKQKPKNEYLNIKRNLWNIPDIELQEGEKERIQTSAFLYHNKLAELANNNSLRDEMKVQALASDLISKNQEKETKKKKEKKVAPSKGALPFSNY